MSGKLGSKSVSERDIYAYKIHLAVERGPKHRRLEGGPTLNCGSPNMWFLLSELIFRFFLGGVGFISVFVTFFFLLDFFLCNWGRNKRNNCDKGDGDRARSQVYEAVDQKRLKANKWNNNNKKKHQLFSKWGIIAFSLNTCSMC